MAEYLIFLTLSAATFGLFALGLNLQWGFTGLINFGHVAFMTLGAYTTVLLSLKGVPLFIAVPIGAALAALLGLGIGFATLRLREDYLGIVTLGAGELIRLTINNQELPVGSTWTPGAFGVQSYPIPFSTEPSLFVRLLMIFLLTGLTVIAFTYLWRWIGSAKKVAGGGEVNQTNHKQELTTRLVVGAVLGILGIAIYISGVMRLYNYAATAGLMLLSVLVFAFIFWRLEILLRSPWGRVLKAIREDEEVPKALGKNVFWYKIQSLMLGGVIAGIAGAFYAWQLNTIYPDRTFEPQVTFDAWVIIILGGSGNNLGTLLGSVIFFAYDAITREVLPRIIPLDSDRLGAIRAVIIGLILMLLMIWRPQGILGKKEELTLGK
ncbi:MAG TPA: branched-chain amino acid ABC transporter permease [Nostocaceae cyanobacterium]|nr:branched-chain amino acid ABC transporter permease [Nostocaceae cyanobacterium]